MSVLAKFPPSSVPMGITGQLYQSSLHFTVSFTWKSKRKTVWMLMKTGLKHNCVKAQCQASLKSVPMHMCKRRCAQMCVCIWSWNKAPRRCTPSKRLCRLPEPWEAWLSVSKMADIISLGVTATAKQGHRGRFLRGSSRHKLCSSWRCTRLENGAVRQL